MDHLRKRKDQLTTNTVKHLHRRRRHLIGSRSVGILTTTHEVRRITCHTANMLNDSKGFFRCIRTGEIRDNRLYRYIGPRKRSAAWLHIFDLTTQFRIGFFIGTDSGRLYVLRPLEFHVRPLNRRKQHIIERREPISQSRQIGISPRVRRR